MSSSVALSSTEILLERRVTKYFYITHKEKNVLSANILLAGGWVAEQMGLTTSHGTLLQLHYWLYCNCSPPHTTQTKILLQFLFHSTGDIDVFMIQECYSHITWEAAVNKTGLVGDISLYK